jgi:sirohydrochlorin ferrochelatase
VLAVPGTAEADTAGIGPTVASVAELSCPGVEILVGYLDGQESSIADCLAPADPQSGEPANEFPRVVVPLLLSPSVRFDGAIRRAVSDSAVPAVLASHLGPHPLVAEALHSRLAEAGLARVARSSGLSISAGSQGIVVLADAGEEATSAAAVAAVLLASRLSVPVVPASLGDPASIVTAVERLSETGTQRPVLAPCLIGPETSLAVLADLGAALDAPCAPVLGAHQAVGQLVAVRYGSALASLTPAR